MNDISAKPSFLFIVADDLGWGDLHCYGHQRIQTPHLDRLAENGILFTQFYVCSSVCSPSRTAFMTGHFPGRHAIYGALGSHQKNVAYGMPDHLDPAVTTLPDLLKNTGYRTGHFGKWHLSGGPQGPLPDQYGFDTFTCTSHLKDEQTKTVTYRINTNGQGWKHVPDNFEAQSSEVFVNDTIRFIEANRGQPFYAQVWLQDVHARLKPTPEQLAAYSKLTGALQIYYSAVTNMDLQIGRLLSRLKELDLDDNTVVIFTSDNGPESITVPAAARHGVGSPGPFRGLKRSLYEGGVRTPFIVRWPRKTPAGQIDDSTVIAGVDLLPTLCSLAGIEPLPALNADGESVARAFQGEPQKRSTPLMWEYRFGFTGRVVDASPMLAIRRDHWKLLMNPDRSRLELYDMSRDPSELNNLAEQHADTTNDLARQLLEWHARMPQGPARKDAGSHAYPWPGR